MNRTGRTSGRGTEEPHYRELTRQNPVDWEWVTATPHPITVKLPHRPRPQEVPDPEDPVPKHSDLRWCEPETDQTHCSDDDDDIVTVTSRNCYLLLIIDRIIDIIVLLHCGIDCY